MEQNKFGVLSGCISVFLYMRCIVNMGRELLLLLTISFLLSSGVLHVAIIGKECKLVWYFSLRNRYVKFVRGLELSPSREVSVMFGVVAGDVRTTTGQNLNNIRLETGLDPLACSLVKVKAELGSRLEAVPDGDVWRVKYLGKLLEARGEANYEGEDTHQLTVLIDSLCSS